MKIVATFVKSSLGLINEPPNSSKRPATRAAWHLERQLWGMLLQVTLLGVSLAALS